MKRRALTYVVAIVALMGVGSVGDVLADGCDEKCDIIFDGKGGSRAKCRKVPFGEKGAYVCTPVNVPGEPAKCIIDLGPCSNGNDFGYPIA
ncbi:MAG: hypothetical protein F4X59_04800 [Holophagales bacterium]|nr:hypothetical protein [Holophagales bacterium]MYC09432.1 hypothetical protein [Holophagales bacterium]